MAVVSVYFFSPAAMSDFDTLFKDTGVAVLDTVHGEPVTYNGNAITARPSPERVFTEQGRQKYSRDLKLNEADVASISLGDEGQSRDVFTVDGKKYDASEYRRGSGGTWIVTGIRNETDFDAEPIT